MQPSSLLYAFDAKNFNFFFFFDKLKKIIDTNKQLAEKIWNFFNRKSTIIFKLLFCRPDNLFWNGGNIITSSVNVVLWLSFHRFTCPFYYTTDWYFICTCAPCDILVTFIFTNIIGWPNYFLILFTYGCSSDRLLTSLFFFFITSRLTNRPFFLQ